MEMIHQNLKYVGLLVYLLGLPMAIRAQSPLEDYIEQGLENNQQYIKQQLETRIAREENRISKSFLTPDISFDASYLLASGGRTIDFPLGDLFNPAYASLNDLTGTQQFPTDIANVSEQFLPNDFHETKIRILQPILNTDIYYGVKASKANISVAQAKEEAYRNQLIFQITKAYFDHMKVLEQKKVLDSTRLVLKESVRVNKKFVQYDVATKEVIYDAQAQLDQLDAQLAKVTKGIHTSRIFFNFLLNRDLGSPILETDPSSIVTALFDKRTLEEDAMANRSELQQLDAGIVAQDLLLKKAKSFLIPEIDVGAEFGFQGFGYTFEGNQDYYLLSFNLNIPILQGNRNSANISRESLKKEQLQADRVDVQNQIKLEVATAFYEYQEAMEVYNARISELANAKENFKVIEAKYRQNQVLLIQFNEARNTLTTAELQETIARYNIKIAEANIKRTTQNAL